MALGRINGPMLQPNLERQGVNIALDANLTYWDVNNRYVGINNTTPNYTLDVNGNVHLGNIYIKGNTITLDSGYKLNLGDISNITIGGGSANTIIFTDGAGNIAFGNLSTLVSIEGFTAANVTIGTPTVGSMTNAVSLSSSTTISNAIALINQNLGNVTANVTTLISVVYSNANAASFLTTYSGNISANIITANIFSGNVSGNINGTFASFSNISGNLVTSAQPYITSVGTLSNLTVAGNITSGNISVLSNFYGNLNGNVIGNISGTTATFSNIAGTLTTSNQPFISNVGTLGNLSVSGNASVGNIILSGSFYGNVVADTITPYQTNVVVFTNTTAIKLPSGGTTARPTGVSGYFRYNSDLAVIEYYNGTGWISVNNQITDQQIAPDGVSQSFTLNQTSTAAGLMVSINGTLQTPGVAYTVSGTTITFAEIPRTTDLIDVRFIASAGTTTLDYYVVDTGNILVGSTDTIIDSFPTSLYRSAKYVVSSMTSSDSTMAEVMVLQNMGSSTLTAYGVLNTGSNTLTFSTNVSGGTVNLLACGTTAINQVKVQRTYFNV